MRRGMQLFMSASLFMAGCVADESTRGDTGADSGGLAEEGDTPGDDSSPPAGGPVVHEEAAYTLSVDSDIVYAHAQGYHPQEPMVITELSPLLDVYYPNDRPEKSPVFMWIHGGGFTGGSKTRDDIEEMAAFYAARGWVFVSINYRTTEVMGDAYSWCSQEYGPEYEEAVEAYRGIAPPEWTRSACVGADGSGTFHQSIAMYAAQRDAKAALRWTVANSATYNVDLDHITVGGNSAGAITTVALGITDADDFRDEVPLTDDPSLATTHPDETYVVQSMVWFWGARTKLTMFENVYGEVPYDASEPPLFMAHGTAEKPGESPTPYTEALEMQSLYADLGIDAELVLLDCEVDPDCPFDEGWGHGAWDATVNGRSLSERVFDFIVEIQDLPME